MKGKTIFWHRSVFVFYYNKTNNDSLLSRNPLDVGRTLSEWKGWSMSPGKHLCNILKKVTSWTNFFYVSLPKPDIFFSGFGFLFSPSPAAGGKYWDLWYPRWWPGAFICSCHQWQTPLHNKILQQPVLSCLWGAVPGLGCLTCSWEEHESIALESPWRHFQWRESMILPTVGWCLYWCVLPSIWWVASISIIFFPAAEQDVASGQLAKPLEHVKQSGSSITWLCCGWKWSVVFS